MGLVTNLRGPQGPAGPAGPAGNEPFTISLVGQVDTAGVTDETSVFTSALSALPTYGGAIILPAGQIKGTFTVTGVKGVQLIGQGDPGTDDGQGHGATEILVPDGKVGFTFGTPNVYSGRGPILQNIRFRGVGSSPAPAGGVLLNGGYGTGILDRVCVSHVFTSYGVRVNGSATTKETGYVMLRDCAISAPLGLDVLYATGVQVRGGLFDATGAGVRGIVAAGSTGIRADTHSDTLLLDGVRMQGYATHVDTSAYATSIVGTRHEMFTTAIKVAADRAHVVPASVANSTGLQGTGTAISLASGSYAYVNALTVNAVATRVSYGTAAHYAVLDVDQATGRVGFYSNGTWLYVSN